MLLERYILLKGGRQLKKLQCDFVRGIMDHDLRLL